MQKANIEMQEAIASI